MSKPTKEKPAKPDVESDSDESDDEDYAPDEKDFQSDGEDEGDSSDDDNTNDGDSTADNNNTSTTRSGKRRADTSSSSSAQKKPKPDDEPTPQEQAEALRRKSRLDALWAEMNTPESSKPASSAQRLDVSVLAGSDKYGSVATGAGGGGGGGRMVTITTTYDFAGETVTVTKDVPEDSKEAKDYAAKKNGKAGLATGDGPKITKTKPPVRFIRRKSTLDQLAATYGVKKPPKLNTLEKSKLDWKNFVGKEGIEDELKHHNKDGYMEKVAFLQRTDERRDAEYQQLKKKRR
ncbi:Craniofacial development protein 1 [Linnemannia exigua]|uniref:SWR1-complex protein 5 n=1 Tax=Linnemannia exigua TaxID=604196 RepID=A0AAD4H3Q2_9FUNG|nr:Craniofacial development protein 1 [Linnemannia exigua]